MKTLVERLRDADGNQYGSCVCEDAVTVREAADYIEALEAAIRSADSWVACLEGAPLWYYMKNSDTEEDVKAYKLVRKIMGMEP